MQPRTQAQITKNRHTTVFLYRSVAKLSERAGVLGEDAGNEAPGRICNKHGGHQPRPQGLPRGGARAEEDPGKIR